MIILTGHEGFIGQNFCEELDLENVYRVEKDDACTFLDYFNDWDFQSLEIELKSQKFRTSGNLLIF